MFHWEPAEAATQISLSTTLAPPITLIQAHVIIAPLPMPPLQHTTSQPEQPAAKQARKLPTQEAQAQPNTSQILQAPQQKQREFGTTQSVGVDQGSSKGKSSPPVPVVCTQQQQPPANLSVERRCAQSGSGQPLAETGGHAYKHKDAAGELQQLPKPQSPGKRDPRQVMGQSQGDPHAIVRGLAGAAAESRLGRWLPPVSSRWQGKQKQLPSLAIQVKVQGSVHGMPAKAQLQVLGQHWFKAKLTTNSQQHSTAQPALLPSTHMQTQDESWRQKLLRRFPWLQPQPVDHREQPQPESMLFQVEVPFALLEAVAEGAERQQQAHLLLQKKSQLNALRPEGLQASPTAQPGSPAASPDAASLQQPPVMLLKLETDFLSKEQPVQVQLPVVWLLGADTQASQAVWQLLKSAGQGRADQHQDARVIDPEPGPAPQGTQHRLKAALASLRRQKPSGQQAEPPQPQVVMAAIAGVLYVLLRPVGLRYIDLLSCTLSILAGFADDASVAPSHRQAEAFTQNLTSRVRAAYHRQQLDQLQLQLQHLGSPSGVVILHSTPVDAQLEHGLGLVAKQAGRMSIMRLGVSTSPHAIPLGLYGIPADDWVVLSTDTGLNSDMRLTPMFRLHQELRGSLAAFMFGLRQRRSRL